MIPQQDSSTNQSSTTSEFHHTEFLSRFSNSRVPQQQGSMTARFHDSRVPKQQCSKKAGFQNSRVPQQQGSTTAGFHHTRVQQQQGFSTNIFWEYCPFKYIGLMMSVAAL
jgi:hypothetical protein